MQKISLFQKQLFFLYQLSMPHPFHSSPAFSPSWNSSLHLQPTEIKPDQYLLCIHLPFGAREKKRKKEKKASYPSSPLLIVWDTGHICLCKTKNPEECGVLTEGLWQVKNGLIFFFLLPLLYFFLFPRHCAEVSWALTAEETQTRPVLCE